MSIPTEERSIAGLRTLVVTTAAPPKLAVIILHGYAMRPEDLAPFAHSMGVAARFYFPEGPVPAEPQGAAWWAIDRERRLAALDRGPRDLSEEHPAGLRSAREGLRALFDAVSGECAGAPIALVGFSQGGMLACDTVLRERPAVAALALLSSSRIAADEWTPLGARLAGLPILVAHGLHDDDLAFAAGEALRAFVESAGADVRWLPFEGGHVIPLTVWRALRALLLAVPLRPAIR